MQPDALPPAPPTAAQRAASAASTAAASAAANTAASAAAIGAAAGTGNAPQPAAPRRSVALEAQQAAQWAREGLRGQDRAAALLLRSWGARLVLYAVQHGRVAEHVAEELAADAILHFVLQSVPHGCPAEVWLWTLARRGLITHVRAQDALERGWTGGAPRGGSGMAGGTGSGMGSSTGGVGGGVGAGTLAGPTRRSAGPLDDDALLAAIDHLPMHVDPAPWVRECVHKAATLMERDEPRHAQVLWMVAQGWSIDEIAVFFGARAGAVDERQRSAARDRVDRACRCAREHFAHCQE